MKRSWIGFVLLLVLLIASLASAAAMEKIHGEAAQKLERAARYALQENWTGAAFTLADVRSQWERWELFRCAFADHGPTEEVEAMFSSLEVYGASRERIAFAAVCRQAASAMKAIGQAHSLNLTNLL